MKLQIQKWFMTQNNFVTDSHFQFLIYESPVHYAKQKNQNINNCSSFCRIDGTEVIAQCINELTDIKLIAGCCLSTMF